MKMRRWFPEQWRSLLDRIARVTSHLSPLTSHLAPFTSYWRIVVSVRPVPADAPCGLRRQSLRPFRFWLVMLLLIGGIGVGTCAADGPTAAPKAKAAEEQEEGIVTMSSVTGTIVTMTKRAISVEYEATGDQTSEMLLPFASNVAVERVQSLKELKPGDTVKVDYRQRSLDDADGTHRILKTVATTITLVRSGSVKSFGSVEGHRP